VLKGPPVKLTTGLARTKAKPTSVPAALHLNPFHLPGWAPRMATHYVLRSSWTEVPSLHRSYPASAVQWTSPTPQGAQPVPHGRPVDHPWPHLGVSRVAFAFLVYMLSPLPRRSGWAYYFAHSPQPYQPSPKGSSGRPAHRPFRGLLGVHSRYGLHTRAVTVYRDTL